MSTNQNIVPALPKPNPARLSWPTFSLTTIERQKINSGVFPAASLRVTGNVITGGNPTPPSKSSKRSYTTAHLTNQAGVATKGGSTPPSKSSKRSYTTTHLTNQAGVATKGKKTPPRLPIVAHNTSPHNLPATAQKNIIVQRPGMLSIICTMLSMFTLTIAFSQFSWFQGLSFVVISSAITASILAIRTLSNPLMKSEKATAILSLLISIGISLLDVSRLLTYR